MEPVTFISIIIGWVLTGVVAGFVMRRRGGDLAVWPVGACDLPEFVGPGSIDREEASQADVPIGTGA